VSPRSADYKKQVQVPARAGYRIADYATAVDRSAWSQVGEPGHQILFQLAAEIDSLGSWKVPSEFFGRAAASGGTHGTMFVQTTTLAELEFYLPLIKGSKTRLVLDPQPAKWTEYTGVDAYGTAAETWAPTWEHEQTYNIAGYRASAYRDTRNGPWLGSGRDPVTNWGITLRSDSAENPDLLNATDPWCNRTIGSRFIWTCCGQREDHPGCWIAADNESEPRPYNVLTNQRGTAWMELEWYQGIHDQIQAERNRLGYDAGSDIPAAESTHPSLQKLFRLESLYNQVHGGIPPQQASAPNNKAIAAATKALEFATEAVDEDDLVTAEQYLEKAKIALEYATDQKTARLQIEEAEAQLLLAIDRIRKEEVDDTEEMEADDTEEESEEMDTKQQQRILRENEAANQLKTALTTSQVKDGLQALLNEEKISSIFTEYLQFLLDVSVRILEPLEERASWYPESADETKKQWTAARDKISDSFTEFKSIQFSKDLEPFKSKNAKDFEALELETRQYLARVEKNFTEKQSIDENIRAMRKIISDLEFICRDKQKLLDGRLTELRVPFNLFPQLQTYISKLVVTFDDEFDETEQKANADIYCNDIIRPLIEDLKQNIGKDLSGTRARLPPIFFSLKLKSCKEGIKKVIDDESFNQFATIEWPKYCATATDNLIKSVTESGDFSKGFLSKWQEMGIDMNLLEKNGGWTLGWYGYSITTKKKGINPRRGKLEFANFLDEWLNWLIAIVTDIEYGTRIVTNEIPANVVDALDRYQKSDLAIIDSTKRFTWSDRLREKFLEYQDDILSLADGLATQPQKSARALRPAYNKFRNLIYHGDVDVVRQADKPILLRKEQQELIRQIAIKTDLWLSTGLIWNISLSEPQSKEWRETNRAYIIEENEYGEYGRSIALFKRRMAIFTDVVGLILENQLSYALSKIQAYNETPTPTAPPQEYEAVPSGNPDLTEETDGEEDEVTEELETPQENQYDAPSPMYPSLILPTPTAPSQENRYDAPSPMYPSLIPPQESRDSTPAYNASSDLTDETESETEEANPVRLTRNHIELLVPAIDGLDAVITRGVSSRVETLKSLFSNDAVKGNVRQIQKTVMLLLQDKKLTKDIIEAAQKIGILQRDNLIPFEKFDTISNVSYYNNVTFKFNQDTLYFPLQSVTGDILIQSVIMDFAVNWKNFAEMLLSTNTEKFEYLLGTITNSRFYINEQNVARGTG
jgi:hypothetical protein